MTTLRTGESGCHIEVASFFWQGEGGRGVIQHLFGGGCNIFILMLAFRCIFKTICNTTEIYQ